MMASAIEKLLVICIYRYKRIGLRISLTERTEMTLIKIRNIKRKYNVGWRKDKDDRPVISLAPKAYIGIGAQQKSPNILL